MIKMVKYAYFLMISLQLISCAGMNGGSDYGSDEDFSWVENSDFKQPTSIPYNPSEDEYQDVAENVDPLSKESLARLPDSKLEDVEEGSPKEISQMMAACYRKNFQAAFKIMDKIYRKYKENPIYWNQVGSCYFIMGDNQKAKLYYNKSIGLKSDYAPPVNNLGVYYENIGFEDKALEAYKEAARLNSFSLTPLFNLSQMYLRHGFYEKSINGFEALYRRKKDDVDILNALATAYLIKGDFKRSIAYFSKIDDDNFRKAHIGINLALALKYGGQENQAIKLVGHLKDEGVSGEYFEKVKKRS